MMDEEIPTDTETSDKVATSLAALKTIKALGFKPGSLDEIEENEQDENISDKVATSLAALNTIKALGFKPRSLDEIKEKVDKEKVEAKSEAKPRPDQGDDSLYLAAMHGDISLVVDLLQKGHDPRYMHDLPMRWATSQNHVGLAILLFLHGSTDFSWISADKCTHGKSEVCCHRLATYTPQFICRLALLHHATLSSLSCSYSNTVRQHFLDMVRHYATQNKLGMILKEIEKQNTQPEYSEPEIGGSSEHNPTQRAKRTCPDGYILEQVPSDGDCFFHCFVKGLMGKGKTSSVQELREIAAKHILQSTDLFEDLLMEWKDHGVVKPDETITQSLAAARILAGKEWATNIIIHILSNHFKIGVKIHTQ